MDRVPTETIPDAVSIDICVSMVTRCRRLSRVQAKTGDRGCSGMTRFGARQWLFRIQLITTAFKRSGAQDSTPLTSVSWVSSVKKVGKRGSTQCARPQPR